jgi:hypothetical protein
VRPPAGAIDELVGHDDVPGAISSRSDPTALTATTHAAPSV